jgi:hypothetical protein
MQGAAGVGLPGADDVAADAASAGDVGAAPGFDATDDGASFSDTMEADSGTTGGAGPDAIAAEDASPSEVWADAGVPPVYGIEGGVLVYELDAPTPDYNRGNALARFGLPDDDAGAGTGVGPCVIREQTAGYVGAPEPSLDAGFVRITGTSQTIELIRAAEPPYDYVSNLAESNPEILGKAGTLVQVTGTGGVDVPAFSGEVPTPAPVKIEAPALGFEYALNTAEALPVVWEPAEATSTVVSVLPVALDLTPVNGVAIHCTLVGDPGKFTVPQEAMKQLPGSFGTRLVVSVTRAQSVVVDAGGVPVKLAITTTRAGIANAK